MVPSGLAQVVSFSVALEVTSTRFPLRFASARATATATGFLGSVGSSTDAGRGLSGPGQMPQAGTRCQTGWGRDRGPGWQDPETAQPGRIA